MRSWSRVRDDKSLYFLSVQFRVLLLVRIPPFPPPRMRRATISCARCGSDATLQVRHAGTRTPRAFCSPVCSAAYCRQDRPAGARQATIGPSVDGSDQPLYFARDAPDATSIPSDALKRLLFMAQQNMTLYEVAQLLFFVRRYPGRVAALLPEDADFLTPRAASDTFGFSVVGETELDFGFTWGCAKEYREHAAVYAPGDDLMVVVAGPGNKPLAPARDNWGRRLTPPRDFENRFAHLFRTLRPDVEYVVMAMRLSGYGACIAPRPDEEGHAASLIVDLRRRALVFLEPNATEAPRNPPPRHPGDDEASLTAAFRQYRAARGGQAFDLALLRRDLEDFARQHLSRAVDRVLTAEDLGVPLSCGPQRGDRAEPGYKQPAPHKEPGGFCVSWNLFWVDAYLHDAERFADTTQRMLEDAALRSKLAGRARAGGRELAQFTGRLVLELFPDQETRDRVLAGERLEWQDLERAGQHILERIRAAEDLFVF